MSHHYVLLKPNQRIIDAVRDVAEYIPLPKGQKLTAEQLLERFLFPRPQQQVQISELSGGERRRLHLLTILMQNPNFLILDEPTNDLDIITLNILEEFLAQFPGCLIIVSHDRYFMDKLTNHLFVFEPNGKIKDFNGTYSEYRRRPVDTSPTDPISKPKEKKESKSGLTYEQRKQISRLEKDINKLETQKASIHEQFNNTNLTPEQIESFSKELAAVSAKLEEKEVEWMALADLA